MPELPDVETFRRYLNATALHQVIARSEITDKRMLHGISAETLQERLNGRRFESTCRHGKYLFTELDEHGWLLLHFGMTGELHYGKTESGDPKYVSLLVRFDNDYTLAYCNKRRLGRIGLTDDPKAFIQDEGLGIDALDEALDADRFVDLLAVRRGILKPALMDQQCIAGIGNIYLDEILFQAGLHPGLKMEQLDEKSLRRLHRTMRRVLRVAIRHQARVDELPRAYLLPHREAGGSCPRCGGTIRKQTISGRSSYFCPTCQQKARH